VGAEPEGSDDIMRLLAGVLRFREKGGSYDGLLSLGL